MADVPLGMRTVWISSCVELYFASSGLPYLNVGFFLASDWSRAKSRDIFERSDWLTEKSRG